MAVLLLLLRAESKAPNSSGDVRGNLTSIRTRCIYSSSSSNLLLRAVCQGTCLCGYLLVVYYLRGVIDGAAVRSRNTCVLAAAIVYLLRFI